MSISDALVAHLTTAYLAVIAAMKAYGLLTGRSFSGVFVLAASTALVAAALAAALTWDVSRKVLDALSHAPPPPLICPCRGGICWHGVAVRSPASQLRLRIPLHHPAQT